MLDFPHADDDIDWVTGEMLSDNEAPGTGYPILVLGSSSPFWAQVVTKFAPKKLCARSAMEPGRNTTGFIVWDDDNVMTPMLSADLDEHTNRFLARAQPVWGLVLQWLSPENQKLRKMWLVDGKTDEVLALMAEKDTDKTELEGWVMDE